MSIAENIIEIQSRIECAAKKSGRNAEDFTAGSLYPCSGKELYQRSKAWECRTGGMSGD